MENEKESQALEKVERPLIIADGLLTDEVIKRAELQVDGLNKIEETQREITSRVMDLTRYAETKTKIENGDLTVYLP